MCASTTAAGAGRDRRVLRRLRGAHERRQHAHASRVRVEVEARGAAVLIRVSDDGVGGAAFAGGSGLVGLRDRVEALGGRLELRSTDGAGTSLTAELPLAQTQLLSSRITDVRARTARVPTAGNR